MQTTDLIAYGKEVLGTLAEHEPGALENRIAAKPIRSALYLPGNRRDFIQKCHRFGADAIVIDLEDAVHPSDREEARRIVSEEVGPLSERVRSVWVRVNPDPAEMEADLEAAVQPGISTIQLSKVFNPASVRELDNLLAYQEGRKGLARESISIAPILETANGIRQAYEVSCGSRRVEYVGALVAAEGDTARALRMRALSDDVGSESIAVRSNVLVAARSAGIRHPLGGVVTDLSPDHSVLRAFATANRNMGYAGMFVIHPSHVGSVNEIFSPSADELRRAIGILEALHDSAGHAAIRGPKGEMIDLAMARFAVLLLEEARDLGIEIPDDRECPR